MSVGNNAGTNICISLKRLSEQTALIEGNGRELLKNRIMEISTYSFNDSQILKTNSSVRFPPYFARLTNCSESVACERLSAWERMVLDGRFNIFSHIQSQI
jgi:hypothetical protein